jgi:hypothetical protein
LVKPIALSSGVAAAVLKLRHVVSYTPRFVRLAPSHFASSWRFDGVGLLRLVRQYLPFYSFFAVIGGILSLFSLFWHYVCFIIFMEKLREGNNNVISI